MVLLSFRWKKKGEHVLGNSLVHSIVKGFPFITNLCNWRAYLSRILGSLQSPFDLGGKLGTSRCPTDHKAGGATPPTSGLFHQQWKAPALPWVYKAGGAALPSSDRAHFFPSISFCNRANSNTIGAKSGPAAWYWFNEERRLDNSCSRS